MISWICIFDAWEKKVSPKNIYPPNKCQKKNPVNYPKRYPFRMGVGTQPLKDTTLSPPRVWIHQGMGRWPFFMVIATSHATIQGLGTLFFKSRLGDPTPPFSTISNHGKKPPFLGWWYTNWTNPTFKQNGGQIFGWRWTKINMMHLKISLPKIVHSIYV